MLGGDWEAPARLTQQVLQGHNPLMTKITVNKNGPLRVEGELELCDATGAAFGLGGRTAVSLCRCGLSANKPFCDGAHNRQGFESAVEAKELPPPAPKP